MIATILGLEPFPTDNLPLTTEIVEHFGSVTAEDVIRRKSKALAETWNAFKTKEEFEDLTPTLSPSIPVASKAIHKVDLLLKQGPDIFFAVELCLNNREGIGSNFLKVHSAISSRKGNPEESAGILIVPSRGLLDFGGWDKAYGDSTEYEHLWNAVYKNLMTTRIILIELHAIF